MENQTVSSYIGFVLLIIMYALLLYVWSNAKRHLTPLIRYIIFFGIIYIGTKISIDFSNGINLFGMDLLTHVFTALMVYFILIGFQFHNKVSYAWRVTKLKNIFRWERCRISFKLMRQMAREKDLQDKKCKSCNTDCKKLRDKTLNNTRYENTCH
ncbi:hypothetical protein [Lacinutrix sp. Hel_I_90]|uniref:hypothetical protein n=1 Tax=Lacinutrix sp. Hel_I_90 TaxID=1249999 RepID=UPI000B2077FC|nr:hypothetical protein [Lacinutrix sp. Hel_I_90]